MNPLEWGPWLYGKFFASHHPIWGYLFAGSVGLILALMAWTQIKDKYEAEHKSLACNVMTVQFEPVFRFFQSPPVYFQRLDTMLRVSLTNQTRRPLYIRGHSVAALKGIEWVQFKNAYSAAFEPYAFGVMGTDIRRFDTPSKSSRFLAQFFRNP